MILALADSMTLHKLAEMTDRIMDVASSTISFVGTISEGGDFQNIIQEEVAAALRTQGRSRPEVLAEIEWVATVLVGVPVRPPNRLQVTREIVRTFAGITSDSEKTRRSAAQRGCRETTGPIVSSVQCDWSTSRSPALRH